MKRVNEFLTEAKVPQVVKDFQQYDSGTVTAFRDKDDSGKQISLAENRKRNKKLEAKIKAAGYKITKAQGYYVEDFGGKNPNPVSEEIFIVQDVNGTGKLRVDLIKFGGAVLPDQDSVLFIPKGGKKAELIGVSARSEAYPGKGKNEKLGGLKSGKGEFYTTVQGYSFNF